MKVAVLHTELAGYTVPCLEALSNSCEEVHAVYWPVQSEAPFDLSRTSPCQFHPRQLFENGLSDWLEKLAPDVVLLSGWIDRGYVRAVQNLMSKAAAAGPYTNPPVCVLCLDNHWRGNLRQRLGVLLFKFRIKQALDWAWVPGSPQQMFARRLGFPANRIQTDYYVADVNRFKGAATALTQSGGTRNRLIYIGRYISVKGLENLWDAFEAFAVSKPEWSLHCFGTGNQWDERRQHPQIKHHGFVQPENLHRHLAGAAAFVMPSLREPWGVVLQEMAAAGLPLIASDAVGAAERFIEHDINGWTFDAGDTEELLACLEKLAERSADSGEWSAMSQRSMELASEQTPEGWAQTVLGFASKSGEASTS